MRWCAETLIEVECAAREATVSVAREAQPAPVPDKQQVTEGEKPTTRLPTSKRQKLDSDAKFSANCVRLDAYQYWDSENYCLMNYTVPLLCVKPPLVQRSRCVVRQQHWTQLQCRCHVFAPCALSLRLIAHKLPEWKEGFSVHPGGCGHSFSKHHQRKTQHC